MDFNTGVVVGICIARGKKGGGGGGSTSDIWKPPSHWLQIPEPADNQAIFYIEVENANQLIFPIQFWDDNNKYGGGTIDWGDGHTDIIPQDYSYICSHPYSSAGQYIVTATCNYAYGVSVNYDTANYIFNKEYSNNPSVTGKYQLKAIKVGQNVKLKNYVSGYNNEYANGIIYIKLAGYPGEDVDFKELKSLQKIDFAVSPMKLHTYAFQNCYSLQEVGTLDGVAELPTGTFQNCHSLKKISLPSVTSISDASVFEKCYSATEISIPQVTSISTSEFYCCYGLRKLTTAEGCNYNGNVFHYCPALYPKPQ